MGARHLLMLFAGIWAVEKKKHVAVEEGGGAIHLVSTSIVLNTCCSISYAVMGARVFHAHLEGEKSAISTCVQAALEKYSACLGLGYGAFGRVSTKKTFKGLDRDEGDERECCPPR